MRFSRQEYWSGLPCPSPGELPDQGSNTHLLLWQGGSLPLSHQRSPNTHVPTTRSTYRTFVQPDVQASTQSVSTSCRSPTQVTSNLTSLSSSFACSVNSQKRSPPVWHTWCWLLSLSLRPVGLSHAVACIRGLFLFVSTLCCYITSSLSILTVASMGFFPVPSCWDCPCARHLSSFQVLCHPPLRTLGKMSCSQALL